MEIDEPTTRLGPDGVARAPAVMAAFGLAIFTGAFLLFLVQPLMARFILPWFGGSPAVWTTCMLFFQVLLLGGYAYAHLSISRLAPRTQVVLHLALLAAALLLLPISPGEHWKPPDGTAPMGRILLLLIVCLGLPYLVLSATGPLMQAWFSQVRPGVSPYRLYALSNVGSLLALASYPFLVEPNLSRQVQAGAWSVGLGVFAMLAAWCGLRVRQAAGRRADLLPAGNGAEEATAAVVSSPGAGRAGKGTWLWFALPACGSVLLLAVTNKICQDIAVVPFLWVLPLSLYLLSFILSFDSPRWYWRPLWLPALALALGAVVWMTRGPSVTLPDLAVLRPLKWFCRQADSLSMFGIIGIYLATLFVCCVVCHGEVYRLRPEPRHLTRYYLMIAGGGAFGGLLVAVVAPLVFRGFFELQAGLFAVPCLVAAVLFFDERSPLYRGRLALAWSALGLAAVLLGGGLYADAIGSLRGAVEVSRNFYGMLKVEESGQGYGEEAHEFTLVHGGTTHGVQYVAPSRRREVTSYYTPTSGIGRTMERFPRQTNRCVGVVGLGTGTMAAWGKAGDSFRIYEINNAVVRLARSRFSYVTDTPARVEIVPGDARLSLEREPNQEFDILVLDAFNSDAIPVHLLTREAFEIYRRHLRSDGVIAVHISNRYLNLEPIIRRTAEHFGFGVAVVHDSIAEWMEDEADFRDAFSSDWALLTRNEAFLKLPGIAEAAKAPEEFAPTVQMWTDDKSDLFRILDVDRRR